METVGILIEKYEEEHHPMPGASGVEALKYLMEEQGMKKVDLDEIGSQGVVSEILNGKRELNVRQIKILAEKFSVSPEVFI
jgi:HTH-type transcriptional regulator/antitoxin HigA